jgi:hypothetical protein
MQSERKQLQRELAEHLRDKDRAKLRLLRAQIGAARVDRRTMIHRARSSCRTAREGLKVRQAEERALLTPLLAISGRARRAPSRGAVLMPWAGWTTRCACGAARSKENDPFFLVPNPATPSLAGAFLLRTGTPWQATDQNPHTFKTWASSRLAAECNVRACFQCGALYACPRNET